jgi:lysophospholipase L1-like esterase
MKTKLRIVGWLALLALSTLNPSPRRNKAKAGQPLFIRGMILLLAAFSLTLEPSTAFAQGTAFSYQGKLNDNGGPATGIYDLRFTIFDAVTNGNVVSGILTNAATPVTNGLFTVTLDFGSGVFTGNARWLEIAVRTNGASGFVTLTPRQPLTPTPYAILAGTAGGLSGTLPVSQVSGVMPLAQLPAAVMTNNATGVTLGGTFNGNATTATTLGSLVTNTAPPVPSSINVCWGDSLTLGINGGGADPELDYPDDLASMLNTATINQGYGGYSSTQIKTVFQTNANLWVYPTIIWSGRNNYPDSNSVLADIATMVSDLNSVGNSNYLVMSIINMTNETIGTAGYVQITNLNYYLSAIYSNRFFDVRKFLVNAANTNLAFDLWTFTNDVPAASLHHPYDPIHLNDAGYLLVAEGVLQSSFLNQNKNVISEGKTRSLIGQALAVPPIIGGIKANGIYADNLIITNSQYGGSGGLVIVGDGNLSIWAQNNTIYMRNPGNGALQSIGSSAFPASAVYANNFYGNAQGLTSLNAAQLTSGTVPSGSLSGAYNGVITMNNAANSFTGNGAGLTSLNASQLTSSTVPLAQLPSAVVTNNESGVTLGGLTVNGTISATNTIIVDANTLNSGSLSPGLIFGGYSSGEGIASKRSSGTDQYGLDFYTANTIRMNVNNNGYVGIGTTSPSYPLTMGSGAYCSSAGVWTSVSDRNAKENFTSIAPGDVLAKVVALPITQWKYKVEPAGVRHIGPVAQDFHAAFGFGDSDKAIGTVDEGGVALAAIQGLNQKMEQKETEITELKARLERLEQLVIAKNGGGQ